VRCEFRSRIWGEIRGAWAVEADGDADGEETEMQWRQGSGDVVTELTVEVCGEEALALQLLHDVVADRPGQPEAIEGGGASAQLVDDNETVRGCGLQHH
jgi:hypothetical protein